MAIAPLAGRWKTATGLSLTGTFSLVAVVSVLVLVSLQRLRGFARHENEVDARATVWLLADQLAPWWVERAADADRRAAGPRIADLLLTPTVERSLADAEFLAEGRLLRRHGYLFEVIQLATPPTAPALEGSAGLARVVHAAERPIHLAIRAWPWRNGRTGGEVYLGTADGGHFRHPNQPARWEGPRSQPGEPWAWGGWTRFR